MAKNTTPSFVVTRRIVTDDRGYDKLNKIMRITERMYNAGVRHCIKQLNELKKDVWYKYCLGQFFACKDEQESKRWSKEIFICAALTVSRFVKSIVLTLFRLQNIYPLSFGACTFIPLICVDTFITVPSFSVQATTIPSPSASTSIIEALSGFISSVKKISVTVSGIR